jgi:hypothetical protein
VTLRIDYDFNLESAHDGIFVLGIMCDVICRVGHTSMESMDGDAYISDWVRTLKHEIFPLLSHCSFPLSILRKISLYPEFIVWQVHTFRRVLSLLVTEL